MNEDLKNQFEDYIKQLTSLECQVNKGLISLNEYQLLVIKLTLDYTHEVETKVIRMIS